MPVVHVATLANDLAAYDAMRASMAAAGYTTATCRFTLFDNSPGNRFEPFDVLRRLRSEGDEPLVVLCHQDLRFGPASSFEQLLAEATRLTASDPAWAVAGTAGCSAKGRFFAHLDEPAGSFRVDALPVRVVSLDENFLLIRREAFPSVSPGLHGFHFYGTDLALNAHLVGCAAYVIDLPLTHLSSGTPGTAEFLRVRDDMNRHWRRYLVLGIVQTTAASDVRVCWLPWLEPLLGRDRVRRFVRWLGLAIIPAPLARRRLAARWRAADPTPVGGGAPPTLTPSGP